VLPLDCGGAIVLLTARFFMGICRRGTQRGTFGSTNVVCQTRRAAAQGAAKVSRTQLRTLEIDGTQVLTCKKEVCVTKVKAKGMRKLVEKIET